MGELGEIVALLGVTVTKLLPLLVTVVAVTVPTDAPPEDRNTDCDEGAVLPGAKLKFSSDGATLSELGPTEFTLKTTGILTVDPPAVKVTKPP